MSDRKINPLMIEKIRQNSEGDNMIADFLINLLYEEAGNPPGWHWKEVYQKKIEHFSGVWRTENED